MHYDGTVKNVYNNFIIWFEYGIESETEQLFPTREPIGVLVTIAMLDLVYKSILNSSLSSNSSWDLIKEILLCKISFRNKLIDRHVILNTNDCDME